MPKKSKTVRIAVDDESEVEDVEEVLDVDDIDEIEDEDVQADDDIEEVDEDDNEEADEVEDDIDEEASEEKVEEEEEVEEEEDLEDLEEDLEVEEDPEEDIEDIVEDVDDDMEASSINSGARRTRDLFDSDGKEEAILELPGWTPAVFDRPLSKPYLTKYEYTHFIGMRAQQLARGAPPFVPAPEPNLDPIRLAQWELKQRCLPFVLKRHFPNGHVESFPLSECEWNESLFEW